jgi:hypothetical protein
VLAKFETSAVCSLLLTNAINSAGFLVEKWKKEKLQQTAPVDANGPSHYASVFTIFTATGLHKSSVSGSSYF